MKEQKKHYKCIFCEDRFSEKWIFALHKLMQNAESSFILLEIATTIGTLELFYVHEIFPREP